LEEIMSKPNVAPYGSWNSPITSDLIVGGTIRLGGIVVDGGDVYWTEGRPAEGGRNAIVCQTGGGRRFDVIPAPFNARTRVHEYGGGDFAVHEGVVYFSNYADQRLYRVRLGEAPEPITPEAVLRYADAVMDEARGRLICVREDHRSEGEPFNTLVSLDPREDPDGGRVLVSGNDFYASPRLSPDGTRLAWVTWNHPNMPWDSTELWVAEVGEDGGLENARRVAGGENVSIFQPAWSPTGVLTFVSDRTGWWNLYQRRGEENVPLVEMAAEFGLPQWVFGMRTYAFHPSGRLYCCYTQAGVWQLGVLHPEEGAFEPMETPYSVMSSPHVVGEALVLRAGSPKEPMAVVKLEPESGAVEVLRRSSNIDLDSAYVSTPEALSYPSEDRTSHALFYPPRNPNYAGAEMEKPPLLVFTHGGPTGHTSSALNLTIQYWTSRGFAVLDVNYGGSTGYGRQYRDLLLGRWGVVDVEDAVNGALYLVEEGKVDRERLAIRGGSAGGYTTLCALTFYDVFKAGASHYGVADLEALTRETHKFESRYLDRLVGPYPEARETYLERSPIHSADRLTCPTIFFQGLEDQVVPPNQAETMVASLKEKGVPVAYVPFAGEQHGFRRAENIKRALDAELYFYSRIFDFELPEPVEPVEIENLP
jgi:dipeptidyl aminopeptidase/acylaminoacyl peptidase